MIVNHGSERPYYAVPGDWSTWCGMPLAAFNAAVQFENASWEADASLVTCRHCIRALVAAGRLEEWLG